MPNHELQIIPSPVRDTQHQMGSGGGSNADFRVILYNDDWHGQDEVIIQLQKATGCTLNQALSIVNEVEARGRGICFRGEREECHRVAGVLREIRLQCEVDCD